MKESYRLELKLTLTDSLEKEVVAFLNSREGGCYFKDLELVEHLGSGIPRILEAYPEECFKFTENFLRMTFPNAWDLSQDEDALQEEDKVREQVTRELQDTMQVTMQVKQLILMLAGDEEREVLQKKLSIKNRDYFRKAYIKEALFSELIEMTIPDKPNSRLQKYRLTQRGKDLQKQLKNDGRD